MSTDISGYPEVLTRIPERPPLLMLDRLEIPGADEGPVRRIRGLKCISMDEPYFQGHFPGTPIMPGVLQVAAIAQAGGVLLTRPPGTADCLPVLKSLHRIKFRRPVRPGDRLMVEAAIEAEAPDGTITVSGQTLVDGEVTCQGSLALRLEPAASQQPKPPLFAPPLMELAPMADIKPIAVTDIMKSIPHRFPFLLVDRILYYDLPTFRMIGLKNITGNEPLWQGSPVSGLPGYLQVEMAAQVGCNLAFTFPENRGKLGVFMAIDDAKFHYPVVPGDQLLIDIVAQLRSRFGKGEARLYVGERLVSEVALKFAVMDVEEV